MNARHFNIKNKIRSGIFYFLDDQLVKCPWKHKQKAHMGSDDEYFLGTYSIGIMNNRNE